MANNPLISVILPVYNGGKFLEESVQSVLEQDLNDFEFLVLDDCSTDNSYYFLQSINDTRFHLFRNDTNKGLFYNLNFLAERSTSPLLKLWSQDDVMNKNCLSQFVQMHTRYPRIGFSYCSRHIIDESGEITSYPDQDSTSQIISRDRHSRIAFYTGSIAGNIANVCINKMALLSVGLFKERMKISADFDMWVRLAEKYETGFISERLVKLRDHAGQLSRNSQYYIYHLKEDIEVYEYLLGYSDKNLKQEGRHLLRKYKCVFYYTLMLKEFLKGRFGAGFNFLNTLSSFDNIFILSYYFLAAKIRKPLRPSFLR